MRLRYVHHSTRDATGGSYQPGAKTDAKTIGCQSRSLPPEIADADIDHDKAGKDQRHRKLRPGSRVERRAWRLGKAGRRPAEGGDIVGDRLGLARADIGWRADAAHLGVVG